MIGQNFSFELCIGYWSSILDFSNIVDLARYLITIILAIWSFLHIIKLSYTPAYYYIGYLIGLSIRIFFANVLSTTLSSGYALDFLPLNLNYQTHFLSITSLLSLLLIIMVMWWIVKADVDAFKSWALLHLASRLIYHSL